MKSFTFEHEGVRVTVRTLSHRLLIDHAALEIMLKVDALPSQTGMHPAEYAIRRNVLELLAHTQEVIGLPFEWIGSRAWLDDALVLANKLFDEDGTYDALVAKWLEAIDQLDVYTSDTDLLPKERLNPDYLETPAVIAKREQLSAYLASLFDDECEREVARGKAIKAGESLPANFDDVQNIGLNYNTTEQILYTKRCLNFLEIFHVMPESGGLDDQDPKRMDDIVALQRFRASRRHVAEYGEPIPLAQVWTVLPKVSMFG